MLKGRRNAKCDFDLSMHSISAILFTEIQPEQYPFKKQIIMFCFITTLDRYIYRAFQCNTRYVLNNELSFKYKDFDRFNISNTKGWLKV